MSLKTNWQEAPKVVTTGRTVRYAAEPTSWADAQGNTVDLYWTVRRVSSMAFEILALTQSAAEEGAAALQREYTRKYARWTADTDSAVSPPSVRVLKTNALLCTSSITPRLAEGSIWHIEATIDEEDTIIADHEPAYDEFEELFALAFAREEADDGGASFVIDEAHWDSVTSTAVVYWSFANIENFNPANVTVQKPHGSGWQTVTIVTGSAGAGGCVIESATNLAFRAVYNLGQSDEVATAIYKTNDPAMPKLTLDPISYSSGSLPISFTAEGAPSATSGLTLSNRWTVRLLKNGQSVTGGTIFSLTTIRNVGGDNYAAQIPDPSGGNYADYFKSLFLNLGGSFTVQLVYAAGENTSAMSATATLRNYAVVESADVIDSSPVSVRVRLGLGSDFGVGMVDPSAVSVSGATVERLANLDYGSFAHAAVVASYTNQTWQLATRYLTPTGSVPSPSGAAAGFTAPTLQVKYPMRYVTEMAYFEDTNRTHYKVKVHDIYWDTWSLVNMIWQKWTGGEWVALTVEGESKTSSTDYGCYFTDDLRAVPVRASDGDLVQILYIPSGADYVRVIKATGSADAVVLTIDWRLDGSVTTFDPTKFEATFNSQTVPLVAAAGDQLIYDISNIGELPSPIPVSLVYDGTTESLPFSFDIA